MKILVIDDKKENLKSAKDLINSLNSGKSVSYKHYGVDWDERTLILPDSKPRIKAEYVSDGKSALKVYNQNFNAILSDIFFNFNESKTSQDIRKETAGILGLRELDLDKIKAGEDSDFSHWWTVDMVESAKSWVNGNNTPPIGVYIASKIWQESPDIPITFCSTVYHHDNISNPVCLWVEKRRKQGRRSWYDDHSYDYNRRLGSGTAKSWQCSLSYVSDFLNIRVER